LYSKNQHFKVLSAKEILVVLILKYLRKLRCHASFLFFCKCDFSAWVYLLKIIQKKDCKPLVITEIYLLLQSESFRSGSIRGNQIGSRLPEEILKHIEMYAIVEIAGQQMKAEKGRKIYVHRLENAEGETVVFNKVLLVDNEGAVKVGTPVVEGASVTVTVLEHVKGDKVLVFKKKRRKSYQKMNGHRQYLTKVQIEEVIG
jgi:large subunit ribosomal protein L21